jgi:ribonucleoside-diphosphate reductase alpha chain
VTREPLPHRRLSSTFHFNHGAHRYTATVGTYPDGRPAEVFLSAGKAGTELEAMARDGAVVLSIALQHGAPVDVLRHAMTRLDDGTAAGPLGRLLDLI